MDLWVNFFFQVAADGVKKNAKIYLIIKRWWTWLLRGEAVRVWKKKN